jgi:hypothetical protein
MRRLGYFELQGFPQASLATGLRELRPVSGLRLRLRQTQTQTQSLAGLQAQIQDSYIFGQWGRCARCVSKELHIARPTSCVLRALRAVTPSWFTIWEGKKNGCFPFLFSFWFMMLLGEFLLVLFSTTFLQICRRASFYEEPWSGGMCQVTL